LSLEEQDPDWLAFIQQELNQNTPVGGIPIRLNLFLIEERLSDRLRPDKEHMYEMAVKKKNKIDLS
jgi:hypothetical protein